MAIGGWNEDALREFVRRELRDSDDAARILQLQAIATGPYCILNRTIATSFTSGVGAAIGWDTEVADPYDMHAAGDTLIKIPRPGVYDVSVSGTLVCSTAPAGAFTYAMAARINGVQFIHAPNWTILGSAIIFSYGYNASAPLALNAGDVIDVVFSQNTGAARSINPASVAVVYRRPL